MTLRVTQLRNIGSWPQNFGIKHLRVAFNNKVTVPAYAAMERTWTPPVDSCSESNAAPLKVSPDVVTVTVTVTDDLLNTKALSLVSRLSHPVQSPNL
jgi:hypothetical protein